MLKKNKKRKAVSHLKTYHKIVKAFTRVNDSLPESQKLSVKIRRKIITDTLYPKFKGKPANRIKLNDIIFQINGIVEMIPPRELCDINLISPEIYVSIDWFAIDEYLESVMPDCVYVKVNAEEYGKTPIFNTRNYAFHKRHVKQIIDNLRELAKNISELDWTGYKKVRPGRKNDGQPDSYFMEFILNIQGQPVGDTQSVHVTLSKKEQKESRKITDKLLGKIDELKSTKRKFRASKKAEENLAALKLAKQKITKKKSAPSKTKAKIEELKVLDKALKQLEKDFKLGILTEKEYISAKKKLYKYMKGGGKI